MSRLVAIAATLLALGTCGAVAQERLITVGGGVTEIVWALGEGRRVVAADSTSTWPSQAAALPRVGYMRALSSEGVLSLRPQVLLASSDAGPPNVLAQLRSAGVKVVILPNLHTFESLQENVRLAAGALGAAGEGERLAKILDAQWRDAIARVSGHASRPRVLFLLAHGGAGSLLGGGTGTGADAMIRYAGGINAAATTSGYKPITPEAVLSMAPDVVLITSEGLAALGGEAKLWTMSGLGGTPAGRARRLVSMDALYLLGFGPRMPQAVRELSDRLRSG